LAGGGLALRDYPDRDYTGLRHAIAAHHRLDPAWVLPGNGAAELFTWAARDAADYRRALDCWGGERRPLTLPLRWEGSFPAPFPPVPDGAAVLWLTNPHNPTGQLWSRASLEPLLQRFALVIADEAFLPLVPGGEGQSLIPLLAAHPNLVVIRSLTKLFSIAGLRLGYALGKPDRLERWGAWRDPWPVNGLAAAVVKTKVWGSGQPGPTPLQQPCRSCDGRSGVLRAENVHGSGVPEGIRVAGRGVELVESAGFGAPVFQFVGAEFTQQGRE
jgi:histidinol-phosphate/aromatic aminotransferase/cobyric acid decarboxylase-like protein